MGVGKGVVLSRAMHLCLLQRGPAAMLAMVLGRPPDLVCPGSHRERLIQVCTLVSAVRPCPAAREVNSIECATCYRGIGHFSSSACQILSVMLTRRQSYPSLFTTSLSPAGGPGGLDQSLPGLTGVHTLLTCRQSNTRMLSTSVLPLQARMMGLEQPLPGLAAAPQHHRAVSEWPGPHRPHPRRPPGLAKPPSAAGGHPAASAPHAATPPGAQAPAPAASAAPTAPSPATQPASAAAEGAGRQAGAPESAGCSAAVHGA